MYIVVCASVKFRFFGLVHKKHCRCIFECGHMVNYLGCLSGAILFCSGTLHYGTSLRCFYPLGSHGAVLMVWPF